MSMYVEQHTACLLSASTRKQASSMVVLSVTNDQSFSSTICCGVLLRLLNNASNTYKHVRQVTRPVKKTHCPHLTHNVQLTLKKHLRFQ